MSADRPIFQPDSASQQPKDEPKAVQMPTREEMLQRLQAAGVYGITPQTDAFYDQFIKYTSDHQLNGMGLTNSWEFASYDTLRQYSPFIRTDIGAGFDTVIDAVTPDDEVANDAKEFRKKVLEEVARKRKASEPKPEELGPADSLNDLGRFSQARQIADIVFEYVTRKAGDIREGIWMEDRRGEDANPYYNQTHRGFFLEGYYGQISNLWTPWGKYGFGGDGSGSWKKATPEILERLGATEHMPETDTEMGTIGPIWAVHRIDGVEVPDPVERPGSQFIPYKEADAAWDALKAQYEADRKTSKGRK